MISTYGITSATDTEFWVYDAQFNAIDGFGNNDGQGTPLTTTQSIMTRTFVPGTYYLAISTSNLANNLASPPDDNWRGGSVMDFPDAVLNNDTTANKACNVQFTDATGHTYRVDSTKVGAFDVNFIQFTVTPEPASLALAAFALLLRRR